MTLLSTKYKILRFTFVALFALTLSNVPMTMLASENSHNTQHYPNTQDDTDNLDDIEFESSDEDYSSDDENE